MPLLLKWELRICFSIMLATIYDKIQLIVVYLELGS
jgi:hypothetical protein